MSGIVVRKVVILTLTEALTHNSPSTHLVEVSNGQGKDVGSSTGL